MDCRRLALRLFFFFLGVLIPLLAFQSAFAACDVNFQSTWHWEPTTTYLGYTTSCDPYQEMTADQMYLAECGNISDYEPPSYVYSTFSSGTCASGTKYMRKGYTSNEVCLHGGSYPNCEDPPPSEPVTCTNGTQDPGESGVDCGGDCSSECDLMKCPDGWSPSAGWDIDGNPINTCEPSTTIATNSVGDCPANTTALLHAPSADPSTWYNECAPNYSPEPTLYSSDDAEPAVASVPVPGFSTKSLSIVESENSTVVNNPDNTSTVTTVKTSTNSDGEEETTTTIKTYQGPDATGPLLAAEVTTEKTISEDENLANVVVPQLPADNVYDSSLSSDDIGTKDSLTGIFNSKWETIPLIAAFEDIELKTNNTVCSVNAGMILGHSLDLSLCRWETELRAAGAVFLALVHFLAFFYVVNGGKK